MAKNVMKASARSFEERLNDVAEKIRHVKKTDQQALYRAQQKTQSELRAQLQTPEHSDVECWGDWDAWSDWDKD